MNKCMHKMNSTQDQKEASPEVYMGQNDATMLPNDTFDMPELEREQKACEKVNQSEKNHDMISRADKIQKSQELKIKVPEVHLKFGSLGRLPDFSSLPDIPKIPKHLTLDENVSDLAEKCSNTQKCGNFRKNMRFSAKPWSNKEESKGCTKAYFETSKESNCNNYNEKLGANCTSETFPLEIGPKSKTPNLCGQKRKWCKPKFRDIFKHQPGSESQNGSRGSRKRVRKFNFKGAKTRGKTQDCSLYLKFKRTKTEGQFNMLVDMDSDSDFDFKVPVLRKRAQSMFKPTFSLCPPPPRNTTQYLSHMKSECKQILSCLPSRNNYEISDENEFLSDTNFDENTPDTCASMEGLVTAELFS